MNTTKTTLNAHVQVPLNTTQRRKHVTVEIHVCFFELISRSHLSLPPQKSRYSEYYPSEFRVVVNAALATEAGSPDTFSAKRLLLLLYWRHFAAGCPVISLNSRVKLCQKCCQLILPLTIAATWRIANRMFLATKLVVRPLHRLLTSPLFSCK